MKLIWNNIPELFPSPSLKVIENKSDVASSASGCYFEFNSKILQILLQEKVVRYTCQKNFPFFNH